MKYKIVKVAFQTLLINIIECKYPICCVYDDSYGKCIQNFFFFLNFYESCIKKANQWHTTIFIDSWIEINISHQNSRQSVFFVEITIFTQYLHIEA